MTQGMWQTGQPNPLIPHGFGAGSPEVTQPGMSPGTSAALGGIALLGGGLLDYYGQRRGAKAMEEEARRQAEMQEGFTAARRQSLIDALSRYNPAARQTAAGVDTSQRMQAAAPAVAAGSKALGVSSASVGAPLLATQRLAGQRAGGAEDARQMQDNLRRMSVEQSGLDDGARFASGLADQSISNAGAEGSQYRLGGQMLSSVGMPLIANAMSQPADGLESGEWQADTGGRSGFREVGLHSVGQSAMTHTPRQNMQDTMPIGYGGMALRPVARNPRRL